MDNKYDILQLLRSVADGTTSPEDALLNLKEEPLKIWIMPRSITTGVSGRGRLR